MDIDKTFSIAANKLLQIIPTTSGEKEITYCFQSSEKDTLFGIERKKERKKTELLKRSLFMYSKRSSTFDILNMPASTMISGHSRE